MAPAHGLAGPRSAGTGTSGVGGTAPARRGLHVPSVIYFSSVDSLVWFSNRIWYPTCCPSSTSISSLTRFATDMAATRLGCVHATMRFFPSPLLWHMPQCTRNCGI